MLSQFGAVAYRRVPLRPFFVGETPPDRREAILVVLSGNRGSQCQHILRLNI